MNAFGVALYFISIFGCLFISHCNIINGAYNISEQDLIKSPAQDVITAYALADSYERNRSEHNLILEEAPDLDEGPSLSSVKLASKWMHSIIDTSDDIDEKTDAEEELESLEEYNSSNSTVNNTVEIESPKVSEPVLEDPYFGTSTSTLADNATVLELLKEQIARDFAPFINAITPAPVKAFLASQFAVLSTKLKLVFRGAFSPLLSTAVKAFRVCGNGLIFISQELLKWQEAYEEGEENPVDELATIIPSDENISSQSLNLEADVQVDSSIQAEAESVSNISPAELEIVDEPDERSEEEEVEVEESEEEGDDLEAEPVEL